MNGFLLHLIRHGAPEVPGLMLGRTDAAPTPEGIAACVAQAKALDFATVIASDLLRARLPAEQIAAALDCPLRIDPRWREMDFGEWDGLVPATIDPQALQRFHDDPDASPPPGGECWSALVARVGAALAEMAPASSLIVTHAGAIRAALASLCGFALHQAWAIDLPYAARLTLRVWPGDPASAQIVELKP